MMTDRELMQQALEALDGTEALLSSMDVTHLLLYGEVDKTITALRERLAQPAHDWEAAYIKQVELHNKTLDELRDALAQLAQDDGVCRHCDGSGCVACDARCLPEQPVQEPVCAHGVGKTKCDFCKQPEQELVCVCGAIWEGQELVSTPPQRKPLTDEEKDAARWRFLVDNSFDKEGVTQFHVWEHSWEPHSQTGEPTKWKQRVRGPALDRFIDRAIEAAHNIKGEA